MDSTGDVASTRGSSDVGSVNGSWDSPPRDAGHLQDAAARPIDSVQSNPARGLFWEAFERTGEIWAYLAWREAGARGISPA